MSLGRKNGLTSRQNTQHNKVGVESATVERESANKTGKHRRAKRKLNPKHDNLTRQAYTWGENLPRQRRLWAQTGCPEGR